MSSLQQQNSVQTSPATSTLLGLLATKLLATWKIPFIRFCRNASLRRVNRLSTDLVLNTAPTISVDGSLGYNGFLTLNPTSCTASLMCSAHPFSALVFATPKLVAIKALVKDICLADAVCPAHQFSSLVYATQKRTGIKALATDTCRFDQTCLAHPFGSLIFATPRRMAIKVLDRETCPAVPICHSSPFSRLVFTPISTPFWHLLVLLCPVLGLVFVLPFLAAFLVATVKSYRTSVCARRKSGANHNACSKATPGILHLEGASPSAVPDHMASVSFMLHVVTRTQTYMSLGRWLRAIRR